MKDYFKIIILVSIVKTSLANENNFYLQLLNIKQSEQSVDYVNNKKQFQLHDLITEQSHKATADLTNIVNKYDNKATLELLAVDHDINNKVNNLQRDLVTLINISKAIVAVKMNILNGDKIYIYGTGSTGRLAKQIEIIWYTFWHDLKLSPNWNMVKSKLITIKNISNIENQLIGEITGGDRALIKSLEGFEDLQLIGKLQLEANKINSKDVVFAVTEGGETSAVIGTILSASKIPNSNSKKLYFVYNNPDKLLLKYDRSKEVLNNPQITKINFTTGSQAITGSTRMQATSSQTLLIASIIEQAIEDILRSKLSNSEMKKIGFKHKSSFLTKIKNFISIQRSIESQSEIIKNIANNEYNTYLHNNKSSYFANSLLTTTFVDLTERSPTFSVPPINSINSNDSWFNIYTNTNNLNEAWHILLHRDFKGLNREVFYQEFEKNIEDPYLKQVALKSLDNATYDQKYLYDLSYNSFNESSLNENDIALIYLTARDFDMVSKSDTPFQVWLSSLKNNKVYVVLIYSKNEINRINNIVTLLYKINKNIQIDKVIIEADSDPLFTLHILSAKLFLNVQSTLVMAKLYRILGNSMLYVNPSNLKLIGRATYLIQIHINRILKSNIDFNDIPLMKYDEANAILFDAMNFIESNNLKNKVAVIPLAIVRVFELLRGNEISWNGAKNILEKTTIYDYVAKIK